VEIKNPGNKKKDRRIIYMTVKSWMDAQRHKGGPVKYLYDKLVELDSSSKVEDLEELIGDEETEGTILARIKALEDAS